MEEAVIRFSGKKNKDGVVGKNEFDHQSEFFWRERVRLNDIWEPPNGVWRVVHAVH